MPETRGRNLAIGNINQLENAAQELAKYRQQSNATLTRIAETHQINRQTIARELMHGAHTQLELNGALEALDLHQHNEALTGELVQKIGALRDGIRQQGEADRRVTQAEFQEVERYLGGALDDFSAAVMGTAAAQAELRELRGEYHAQRAAPVREAEAWGQARRPDVIKRKPAATALARPRFASLGIKARAASLALVKSRG